MCNLLDAARDRGIVELMVDDRIRALMNRMKVSVIVADQSPT